MQKLKEAVLSLWAYLIFLIALICYGLSYLPKMGWVKDRVDKFVERLDIRGGNGVSKMFLIEMALQNMKSKKIRTLITIGGMAVGVGAIVFLVSIGYGLEKMVVNRVAGLNELRMTDVSLNQVSSLKINDEVIEKIRSVNGVDKVIPVVSMVSKVNVRNSILDLMAFGVNEDYMEANGIKLISGKEFKDKETNFSFISTGEVAGVSQETRVVMGGERVSEGLVRFNINESERMAVYTECGGNSEYLGLAVRVEGGYIGEEIWGEHYYLGDKEAVLGVNKDGKEEYAKWLKAKMPIWVEGDEEGLLPVLDEEGRQKWVVGCGRESGVQILGKLGIKKDLGEVLGVTATDLAKTASNSAKFKVVGKSEEGMEWVEVDGGETEKKSEVQKLSFYGLPAGEAYVSSGMMKLLGFTKDNIVGQKFKIMYLIPDGLVPGTNGRVESEEVEYTVTGVIDDDNSNYYYYQLSDAKRLGIKNYSQLKVVVKKELELMGVRKFIETLGFRTTSTVDTVAEINKMFGTLRVILGVLGTIALAVASLGMLNTMTVSLLERTKEVGAMKAMGMTSLEVKDLFLAESMIMGLGGGVLGVLLGIVLGQLLSFVLSSVSVLKGQSVMGISHVPVFFVLFILGLSFIVGIVTGWYPSRRARKISALNALRYE